MTITSMTSWVDPMLVMDVKKASILPSISEAN